MSWLSCSFTEIGPQALHQMLLSRTEEIWMEVQDAEDEPARAGLEAEYHRLQSGIHACTADDGSTKSTTPEDLSGLSAEERDARRDNFHEFLVELCVLYDVHPVHPGTKHGVGHCCYALFKGAPYWR
jgi:hypothetical protein